MVRANEQYIIMPRPYFYNIVKIILARVVRGVELNILLIQRQTNGSLSTSISSYFFVNFTKWLIFLDIFILSLLIDFAISNFPCSLSSSHFFPSIIDKITNLQEHE